MSSTVALIPAAGASSRLGQPKQLVRVDAEPLVRRAARLAFEAGCARVVVVEGAVPLAEPLAGLDVELVTCAAWARGPGASLRAGAAALREGEAGLVWLVDQWRVGPAQLRALLEAPGEVVAAFYDGALGVPARFGARFVDVLRQLPDHSGARAWLRAHAGQVTALELPEAAADLDTPEQLRSLDAAFNADSRLQK